MKAGGLWRPKGSDGYPWLAHKVHGKKRRVRGGNTDVREAGIPNWEHRDIPEDKSQTPTPVARHTFWEARHNILKPDANWKSQTVNFTFHKQAATSIDYNLTSDFNQKSGRNGGGNGAAEVHMVDAITRRFRFVPYWDELCHDVASAPSSPPSAFAYDCPLTPLVRIEFAIARSLSSVTERQLTSIVLILVQPNNATGD
ncbi:hypothetical protein BDZ89DRAFT_1045138 [Hymenopellis radicata]|nr:hypothetical protein BDZ89DRAFT_1045138 [Hymenopellis radicata]